MAEVSFSATPELKLFSPFLKKEVPCASLFPIVGSEWRGKVHRNTSVGNRQRETGLGRIVKPRGGMLRACLEDPAARSVATTLWEEVLQVDGRRGDGAGGGGEKESPGQCLELKDVRSVHG